MHAAFGFFKTREQGAKAQPSTAQHRAVVVISVNKHNPIRPVTVHISTVEAVDLTEPAPMQTPAPAAPQAPAAGMPMHPVAAELASIITGTSAADAERGTTQRDGTDDDAHMMTLIGDDFGDQDMHIDAPNDEAASKQQEQQQRKRKRAATSGQADTQAAAAAAATTTAAATAAADGKGKKAVSDATVKQWLADPLNSAWLRFTGAKNDEGHRIAVCNWCTAHNKDSSTWGGSGAAVYSNWELKKHRESKA
jgi:hypothetical protein